MVQSEFAVLLSKVKIVRVVVNGGHRLSGPGIPLVCLRNPMRDFNDIRPLSEFQLSTLDTKHGVC
jgi:hypothetical protein